MPEAPVISAPAPAAPSAPAAPAPVSSTPAAPAPVTPSAPAVTPSAPATPSTPAAFDPQTSATPPNSADYPSDAEGQVRFMSDNSKWSLSHEEEAGKIREAKLAAENGEEVTQPTAELTQKVEEAEQPQPDAPKTETPAAVAATPAAIEEWTTKSPELKALFAKSPELQAQIMEMARTNEAAKPVLEIVSTPEEARFAVDNANRLVGVQSSWMLAAEDPDMIGTAYDQTVEFFKERDANGAEVKGADGQPKMGADFPIFQRSVATPLLQNIAGSAQAAITALEARLAGNYPSEEARAADADALEQATYRKAAYDFILNDMKQSGDTSSKLPALPPGATPEQVAYQKELEKQQAELDAKSGKQTTESRKAASKAVDSEVQKSFETTINTQIETAINAMKERGEYLPDFVLQDKWINPATGKVTGLSAFGVKMYTALKNKLESTPIHVAKIASLQALGAAGKEARISEMNRLTTLYLPKIIETEIKRIQDGIRSSAGKKSATPSIARVEPQSQGTVVPQGMDSNQIRQWAETEAAKDPNFSVMSRVEKEALTMKLAMQKKFGG